MMANSYVRACVVNAAIFVGVLIRYLQKHAELDDARQFTLMLSTLGVAFVVSTLATGTLSRRAEKPSRWLTIGAISFASWLAALLIMLAMQQVFHPT